MVGGVKALILLLVVVCLPLVSGCSGKHHVAFAQAKVADLEHAWLKDYNKAAKLKDIKQRTNDKAATYEQFHQELAKIDISKCPDDYKQAFKRHASVVEQLSEAWNKHELESIIEAKLLEKKRVAAGKHLNRIYHGHIK